MLRSYKVRYSNFIHNYYLVKFGWADFFNFNCKQRATDTTNIL